MKNLKWLLMSMLLISLALTVVACGGEDPTATPVPTQVAQAPEPTNTPVPEPTDTQPPPPTDTPPPQPTDAPPAEPTADTPPQPPTEGGEGFALDQVEDPTDLDSFRSSMELSWQGTQADGTEVSQSMMIAVEFVREPFAQHVSISGDFPGMEDVGMEEGQVMEIYIVEGTMYMNLFGGWIQAPAEEGGMGAEDMAFTASEEMLQGLENANYEGTTTYNGIEVEHYTFDETSFSPEDMPSGMDIEEASGNVYIAVDGGYIVHMDMVMSGANMELPTGEEGEVLQNGSMELTVDLSDINQPITIVVPPEAMEGGQPPEDIPVMANAEEVQYIDFMGMVTYLSASSPEEVAEFYNTEMPNNGWTSVSSDQMGDLFMLEFSKDNRTASLMISLDSETGKTSVLITIEEQS